MNVREVPASAGQRLLWFLDRYRGQTGALNCPMMCRIKGRLDQPALEAAIDRLVARHDSLRTTFAGGGRALTQLIHPPAPVAIRRVDAVDLDTELATELRTRIDPVVSPLRTTLWRCGPDDHVFCLNMHHMVTDTWSCDLLFRELAAAYEGAELPPVGWQYAQFRIWQERQFASPEFARHRDYWREHLAEVRPPELPVRPGSGGRRLGERVEIDSAAGAALRDLARTHRTTIFAVMLALYYTLLRRLTGQNDLAVASVFANRTRPEVQNTVGFLANLLVLRTHLRPGARFIDVLGATRTTVIDAFAHQALPFHLLPAQPAGDLRMDDLVFQMLADPLDLSLRSGRVEFAGLVPDVAGRFDFELALMPRGDGFAAKLYFTEGRIDHAWARGFLQRYASLTESVAGLR